MKIVTPLLGVAIGLALPLAVLNPAAAAPSQPLAATSTVDAGTPTDPDADNPDLGAPITVTADPNAPGVSDDDSGAIVNPDYYVGEPACGGPLTNVTSGSTSDSSTIMCPQSDNPAHYYLRIQKVGSGGVNLLLCRSWGGKNSGKCATNSDTGSLYKDGENSYYKFGWKDADGVYVPKDYYLVQSISGPDHTVCGARSYSFWCKTSASASNYDRPTLRKFYLKHRG